MRSVFGRVPYLEVQPSSAARQEADTRGRIESVKFITVVLDTVIATGDTVAKLCDELWELSGRRERSVVVMCCYAAPAALVRLSRHPVVQYIVVARWAEGCDEAGYLVPTTNGDIGDKLFGEKT